MGHCVRNSFAAIVVLVWSSFIISSARVEGQYRFEYQLAVSFSGDAWRQVPANKFQINAETSGQSSFTAVAFEGSSIWSVPQPAGAETDENPRHSRLSKLRDLESGWIGGAYVGKNRDLVPLTAEQRRRIYLKQTLTSPGAYLKRMFAAGIDQARGVPAEWGGGIGGYGTRFASREGQFIAANSLAAFANAKLKYEPRYEQCRCSGFWPRTRHAILRNFVTYNSTEQESRPQWGLYGGALGGGLISTAWKPHPRNAFAEGGRAVLGQAGYGAALNVFLEFVSDINRKLGAKQGTEK
jgi:hypothetical protein